MHITFRNIFSAILISVCAQTAQSQCPTLLWSDEFDGTSLNASDWNVVVGGGGFGNNEKQYYTSRSNNLQVGDGKLTITALQEAYNGQDYTSAKINSAGKHKFTYGRFEASIKLPRTQGLWPAFWMMPENSVYGGWPASGEIDIMEGLGSNTYKNFGTIHYGASVAEHEYYGNTYTGVFDLAEDFHVYAIDWQPDTIKWFIDNHLFHIARPSDISPAAWPFDQDFYMIFNLAVGGWFGGDPNGTTVFPQTMQVDYVRVYSNPYTLLITGNERVLENSVKTYTIENGNADTYNWTVPTNATITDGQGTKEITVKWGDRGGNVSVEVTKNGCGNFTFNKEVIVNTQGCDLILDDFESNRIVLYTGATGTSYNSASDNPSPSALNNSTTVGYYKRNSVQYDVMYYNIDVIDNSADYENGSKVLYMDLYTDAPVGSVINWQLENKAKADLDYPSGRRAVFIGTTTVQNQWERIKFSLVSKPDENNTSPNSIDQFTILFRPNSYNAYNFYMDNLMSRDVALCGALPTSTLNANDILDQLQVTPNPADQNINIKLNNNSNGQPLHIRIVDMMGIPTMNHMFEGVIDFNETMDVSKLSPGIYLLEVQQGDKIASKKIVIQ